MDCGGFGTHGGGSRYSDVNYDFSPPPVVLFVLRLCVFPKVVIVDFEENRFIAQYTGDRPSRDRNNRTRRDSIQAYVSEVSLFHSGLPAAQSRASFCVFLSPR